MPQTGHIITAQNSKSILFMTKGKNEMHPDIECLNT